FNNAYAHFDARSFRKALDKYGIIANVCPNTRNGEPSEEYLFDEVMYKERFVIERTITDECKGFADKEAE
ncbi:MAG: hypothetical protein K2K65_11320, partial [Duncaniella sp.]|nr:hypothetical protein [Duncaniella sp.]